jgi:hypothetical protein
MRGLLGRCKSHWYSTLELNIGNSNIVDFMAIARKHFGSDSQVYWLMPSADAHAASGWFEQNDCDVDSIVDPIVLSGAC